MWQIMWLLSFLPNIFWHILTIGGVVAVFAALVLKRIPVIGNYRIPLQYGGIVAVIFGVWMEGGIINEAKWTARVKELEAKVAAADTKSQEENVKIVTEVVNKTKVIHTRGQDIINYVDREVIKDREVVKFVENCPIPSIIIKTHNAAALNQPIEILVPKQIEPAEPTKTPESQPIALVQSTTPVQPAIPKQAANNFATVKSWSNIRSSKDTSSEKLDKLPPGTKIEILKIENMYVLVKHDNKQGWILKEFINI